MNEDMEEVGVDPSCRAENLYSQLGGGENVIKC